MTKMQELISVKADDPLNPLSAALHHNSGLALEIGKQVLSIPVPQPDKRGQFSDKKLKLLRLLDESSTRWLRIMAGVSAAALAASGGADEDWADALKKVDEIQRKSNKTKPHQ